MYSAHCSGTYDYELDALNHERQTDAKADNGDENTIGQCDVEAILCRSSGDIDETDFSSAIPESIDQQEDDEHCVHEGIGNEVTDQCSTDATSGAALGDD